MTGPTQGTPMPGYPPVEYPAAGYPPPTQAAPAAPVAPPAADDLVAHAASAAPADTASLGDLMGRVTEDLSTLMRQELALAKAELRHEAAKSGKGAGLLGGAGFAGYFVLLFLSFALWWGLANVMDIGLAALVVAVLWGCVAGVLYALGRRQLREVEPRPERTVETLQEVPETLKGR